MGCGVMKFGGFIGFIEFVGWGAIVNGRSEFKGGKQ